MKAVLDASAVIALLRGEPGADVVAAKLGSALISAVNLQEVYKHLLTERIPPAIVREMVSELRLDIRIHDEAAAFAAASLAEATRAAGSGLGDRSCMALAIAEKLPALTADKAWSKVKAKDLEIEIIR